MPVVSVKLDEATKQRVQSLARSKGATVHAVMVQAIETALDQHEAHSQLVLSALQARAEVLQNGKVTDGHAFNDYLKAKVRGAPAKRPESVDLLSVTPGT